MKKKFLSAELERDFDVLFGSKSHWTWPFWDEDIFTTAFNAVVAGFFAGLFFELFGLDKFLGFKMPFWGYIGIALIYCLAKDNYEFIRNWQQRKRMEKKYIPVVEKTEAYQILLDALDSRRRGVIEGAANKEESRELLIKLWKAAFAEASSLRASLTVLESGGDIVDDRPIGQQIKEYLSNRQEAFDELQS